jgi:ubiquinone/menaquinone biosynthesis C-methylase UbiE
MARILDFFAQTNAPYLHATGKSGTALLLEHLPAGKGGRILEIGFGTGQTLVEIAVRRPENELFGIENAGAMLRSAQKRLNLCGLAGVRLAVASGDGALPYPSGFFDAVIAESVLAILPDEDIPLLLASCARVLKPGGLLLFNESLWRSDVSRETMREINQKCLNLFGIPQASDQFAFPDDWERVCLKQGLFLEKKQHLSVVRGRMPVKFSFALAISGLYSYLGRLKRAIHPVLSKQAKEFRKAEEQFKGYGVFLEGVLFVFKKG